MSPNRLSYASYCLTLLLMYFFQCWACNHHDLQPMVTVKQGKMRGSVMNSITGRPFYAFRKVPFAKPPLAELRFRAPVPADSWEGILDATKDSVPCSQLNYEDLGLLGQEDCLALNIYTPMLPAHRSNINLPVLVYIHPGGFMTGDASSESTQPQRIMNKDVVLVVISYRLGPFGFLSTGDKASYGNYGMLDQVLALKWVQYNIGAFGGDAQRVTLWGQSAGGASIVYHMMSPLSKGLYRGGILQSGSPLCPWAFQKDPLKWAIKLANEVHCSTPTNNTSFLVQCLRNKTALELVQGITKFDGYDFFVFPYVPAVEGYRDGAFLLDTPMNLLKKGKFTKVPLITGVVKDEMQYNFSWISNLFETINDAFFKDIFPPIVENLTKYDNNLVNISYAIKGEYFENIDVSDQKQVNKTGIDVLTDGFFKAGNDMTVRLLTAQGVPVYTYVFEYVGSFSNNDSGEYAITHEDELLYLFNRTALSEADLKMSYNLINWWTNFAYNLKPTPNGRKINWTPTPLVNDLHYLAIEQDSVSMKEGYLTERMNFWNKEIPAIANA